MSNYKKFSAPPSIPSLECGADGYFFQAGTDYRISPETSHYQISRKTGFSKMIYFLEKIGFEFIPSREISERWLSKVFHRMLLEVIAWDGDYKFRIPEDLPPNIYERRSTIYPSGREKIEMANGNVIWHTPRR